MNQFCHSCGIPVSIPEFKGPSQNYCKHCTDKDGVLKPKSVIQQGIAQWIQSWQEGISQEVALKRSEHYMKAMPAWAD
jgi:hypothetical protein